MHILQPPSSTLLRLFFFNDTATTEIYTLSLHDALPISAKHFVELLGMRVGAGLNVIGVPTSEATRADAVRCGIPLTTRSEEHTSELQSHLNIVCRLLLEKKKTATSEAQIVMK